MKPIVHATAGATAMIVIASFWTATVISELLLDHSAVAAVKQAIVDGLVVLVPCMVATGGSGFVLSKACKGGALLARKKKRMAIIGTNGLLLMIPIAIFLDAKAGAGEFEAVFYLVQAGELIVGAIQLALMGMNFRDGLRLAGRLRTRAS